jgi:hypothetical protein
MQSEIKTVSLSSLDPNPLRHLSRYPFNDDKLDALRRSIRDVGLWEGVIARKTGGRYQIAFGHHRVEAGRKELGKEARIPVIVRDLTDVQMLQFMGRENMEDYNADFLVMLESWEAAVLFLERDKAQKPQDIDVARLLGWLRPQPGERKDLRLDNTASACAKVSKLIEGGYIDRDTVKGLPVHSVREIAERVMAQHEMLERMGKKTQRPAAEIERSKKISARAGGRVAKDVRSGRLAARDIRGAIDVHAYRAGKEKKSPLFAMFGKSLADQIEKVCKHDNIAEKFNEIKKALNMLTEDDDIEVVKLLAVRCEAAAGRFETWQRTFTNPKRKVVPLKEIAR